VEQTNQLASLLRTSSAEIGVSLRSEQLGQFMTYLDQLQIWNRSVNLTAITVDDEIIIKHFVDSLAGLRAETIRGHARVLDIGTGAGFPGIPLRIAREDLNVTLIEPGQKKVSFLHFIVGLLRLERVEIFHGTLERFLAENITGQAFDYITTRALKYDALLREGSRLLAAGGRAILYLSHPIDKLELGGRWSIVNQYEFHLPRGFGRRVVSTLSVLQASKPPVPRGTSALSC
jgi:16S rRNA (guanine527-N7)-methyltransferase